MKEAVKFDQKHFDSLYPKLLEKTPYASSVVQPRNSRSIDTR